MKRSTFSNMQRMASASVLAFAWFSSTSIYAQTAPQGAAASQVDSSQAAPASTAVSSAPAQTTNVAPATEPEQQGLGEIIVTAQRREQALSKVPISVQALDNKQLRVASRPTQAAS
jgi:outer membrane receptor protein involved in Fe transport